MIMAERLSSFHFHNSFADGPPRTDGIEGVEKPFEGKYHRRRRLYGPRFQPKGYVVHEASVYFRLVPADLSAIDANERGSLKERDVERQCRNFSSSKTDDQMAPPPAQCAESDRRDVAAYGIEDYVHWSAIGH